MCDLEWLTKLLPWCCVAWTCLVQPQQSLAARAWDDFVDPLGEDARSWQSMVTWGDKFSSTSGRLWQLDRAWLMCAAVVALFVVWFQPEDVIGVHREERVDSQKLKTPPWYRTLFASLSSHAAGIVGFVGFQKIVVARIVTTSQPDDLWSVPNFLLYTSITISMMAIFTSLVFLAVDYLRRLAIHSAGQQKMRVVLKRGRLEHTGLGTALILLTLVLLLLYLRVIHMESGKKEVADNKYLLLERVFSGMTVLLYFQNLHSLCESPKVQFCATCVANERDVTLEEFLEHSMGGVQEIRSGFRNTVAAFLHHLAGEDLALFMKRGSRRAFFPGQKIAPLAHVVCCLLLIGALPCVFQFATEQLFNNPEIVDVKPLSAVLLPEFEPRSKRDEYLLLLERVSPRLQVKPKFEQATRVSICCGTSQRTCSHHNFEHSLILFDDRPAVLIVPANSSARCTLTVLGLSREAKTEVYLRTELLSDHNLCSCTEQNCSCCDGFSGEWDARSNETLNVSGTCAPAQCNVANSNQKRGLSCRCREKFEGNISWKGAIPNGPCVPAPCNVQNSNKAAGDECRCLDGFAGELSWDGQAFMGHCTPAACSVANSNMQPGVSCRCADGYQGSITWNGTAAIGECVDAQCDVANSNRQPGKACLCTHGFAGTVTWNRSRPRGPCTPAKCDVPNSTRWPGKFCECSHGFAGDIIWNYSKARGPCKPATCNVPNTINDGPSCRCKDGFAGSVSWHGDVAKGTCRPARCSIPNSTRSRGPDCACLMGYTGHIKWKGSVPSGTCSPMLCKGVDSNRKDGPDCDCADGFVGRKLTRRVQQELPYGVRGLVQQFAGSHNLYFPTSYRDLFEVNCSAAPCDIPNSNGLPGHRCQCMDGYIGFVTWSGHLAKGNCTPASCQVMGSNKKAGLECACQDGFDGNISWNGSSASGTCMPAPCRIPDSDYAAGPACRCLRGFSGKVSWKGPNASGTCRPRPVCSQDNQIVYATPLEAKFTDVDGNTCEVGEPMVVRGHVCNDYHLSDAIQWTSAESKVAGKCRWSFDRACGRAPALDHFSLPTVCSKELGLPRCTEEIEYSVTVHKELGLTCAVDDAPHVQLAKFHGRRCGYDLIQWEFANVSSAWLQPLSAQPCLANLSLQCGKVPDRQLPKACAQLAEPALFETHYNSSKFLLKFFDNGQYSLVRSEDLVANDETMKTWHSDADFLSIKFSTEEGTTMLGFRRGANDGSVFVGKDSRYNLTAPWPLPSWWTFQFQQQAVLPSSFNADRLVGCRIAFTETWQSKEVCYIGMFGQEIWSILHEQAECTAAQFSIHDYKKRGEGLRYLYVSSAFGVQTYRSAKPCLPDAAYEELRVVVEDVRVSPEEYTYTISRSPCRTTIRYTFDARSEVGSCKNVYEEIYETSAIVAGEEDEEEFDFSELPDLPESSEDSYLDEID